MTDRAQAVVDWLLAEGLHVADMGALVEALAERLTAAGVPVARVASMVETLHPVFIGAMRVWEPGSDMRLRRVEHDDPLVVAATKLFVIDEVQRTGDWVDMRLEGEAGKAADAYDLLPRLRDEGHTHYVLMPLKFRDEPLHGMSFSTRRPGGFSDEDMALLRVIRPALSAAMNVVSLHRMWGDILKAYVGREPAGLILKGAIRRGDVRRIRAALFVSDMRGFTEFAGSHDPEATVAAINGYLERVVPPVVAHGGEVLKFMGDGVLAIFPITGTRDAHAACAAALAAARAALAGAAAAGTRVGMALHVGEAAYGNIGAGDRLDFTIIGRDVNLLARLEKLCGSTGEPVVLSGDFVAALGAPARAIGEFELKGFAGGIAAFAPGD